MKRSRKISLAVAAALTALAPRAFGQISLTGPDYTESFDALGSTAVNQNLTTALGGWSTFKSNSGQVNSYTASTGSSASGFTYSYGVEGTNSITDRALGSIASGTSNSVFFGAQFLNAHASDYITGFTLTYTGEQWRDAGNTTLHKLDFSWSETANNVGFGSYTNDDALDFNGPIGTVAPRALDGNDPLNRVTGISSTITGLAVAPGSLFMIRWSDINDGGSDHGLGIDDLTLTPIFGAPPPFTGLVWDANTGTAGPQDGAGTWVNAGNNWWDPNASAQGAWDSGTPRDARFGSAAGGAHTVTVDAGGVTVNKLSITAAAPTYTFDGAGLIHISSGMLAQTSATFSAPVDIISNQQWNVAPGQTITSTGGIFGLVLTKVGAGTLSFTGAGNSMGLEIAGGTVEFNNDNQLGGGEVLLAGGTLRTMASVNIAHRLNFTGATIIDTNGFDSEVSGDIVGAGGLTKVGAGVLTLSNPSEPAPNNFAGATTINGGTVKVTAESGNFSATGSGPVSINNGATFEIANIKMGAATNFFAVSTISLNNGGTLQASGIAEYNDSDNLRIENGTSGSPVLVDLKTLSAADKFTIGNTVRGSSAANVPTGTDSSFATIRVGGPGRIILASGSYNAISSVFRGEWELNGGILQLGPIAPGNTGSEPILALGYRYDGTNPTVYNPVTINAGAMLAIGVDEKNPNFVPDPGVDPRAIDPWISNPITLAGGTIASTAYDVDASGVQNPVSPVHAALGGALTLNSGAVLVYNPIQNNDVPGDDYLSPRNVNIVSSADLAWGGGTVVVAMEGGNQGGALKFARSGGTVSVTPGSTLQINPATTVELDGAQDALSDGTNHVDVINNSTSSLKVLTGIKNAGAVSGVGNTTVAAGATFIATHIRQNALSIDGNVQIRPNSLVAGVSKLADLSVNPTGKLDLTDNKLIASDPVGTFVGGAYDGVSGLVDAARGSAGNAMWDGTTGITTSDTRAINNGDLVSIGVAKVSDVRTVADTATTTFAGQTVLGSDTLAMVTWGGDANLDGKINIDDYGRIDGNVGQSGSVFGWSKGDFNYDGKINIDDYGIIDGNINRQGAPFVTSGSVALDGVSAVPEPASIGVMGLAMVGLLRRRRRPVSSMAVPAMFQ